LTASYSLLADALREWHVDFVTPTHGLFLWAKLARSAAEEKSVFDALKGIEVRVGERMVAKGREGDHGWARIRFSLGVEEMREALVRMERVFAKH
jgi:DNA-binding transcriptional MocR family regulator